MTSQPVQRVLCPACEALIRIRTATRRPQIDCPRCGASVPLAPLAPPQPIRTPAEATGRSPIQWIFFGALASLVFVLVAVTVGVVIWKFHDPEEGSERLAHSEGTTTARPLDTSTAAAASGDRPAENRSAAAARPNRTQPVQAEPPGDPRVALPKDAEPSRPETDVPPRDGDPAEVDGERQDGAGPEDGGLVTYRWAQNRLYQYEFTIDAEVGHESRKVSGTCQYAVDAPRAVAEEDVETGTGTAFVVTADGYLVTCAHVVQDAAEIQVTLEGQDYAAALEAIDFKRDLAVLKVTARDLTTLPLGDSQTVELAQDIFAVGYPLSDILGNNVKITRGTVAGLNEDRRRGPVFQVDAAINPGNSGGPVLNPQGHVVGVASSKLAGSTISKVGFAVPSNAVRDLLQSRNIAVPAVDAGAALSGPELARRAIPATALVTVTLGPQRQGRVVLKFDGSFTDRRMASGARPGLPGGGAPQRSQGRITVDRFGSVVDVDSEDHLPFLLGQVGGLIFEPLSDSGQERWGYEHDVTLTTVRENQDPLFPFGPRGFSRGRFGSPFDRSRFGPRFGIPSREQPDVQVTTGVERATYELRRRQGPVLIITKSYTLTSSEARDGEPAIDMRGEGTLRFDAQQGLPLSLEFKAMLTRREATGQIDIPIRLSYALLDTQEQPVVPGKVPGVPQ